jgi:hypothetical protein
MTVNPFIWFGERELTFVPKHFIRCPTAITLTSQQWIQNNATGRFAIAADPNAKADLFHHPHVYFENNTDAIMYELMWT